MDTPCEQPAVAAEHDVVNAAPHSLAALISAVLRRAIEDLDSSNPQIKRDAQLFLRSQWGASLYDYLELPRGALDVLLQRVPTIKELMRSD